MTFILNLLSFYSAEPQQDIMEPISKIEWCISYNVTPEETDILDFLRKIASLTNEVETAEHANELLFTLLSDYPYATIIAIGNMKLSNRERIYTQLYEPVHDGIDYCLIFDKIKDIKFKTIKHYFISRRIQHILSSLKTLHDK